MNKMNQWPKQVTELPTESYLAIITNNSVNVPGDERSRTNPGHGYPAYTERSFNIEVYESEDSWKKEVERLTLSKSPFQAVRINPAKITTSVSVTVQA